MPGKSPHAHERPAWHAPAQRPRTGRRPGGAARPHPRGMSFCPSKAISRPVPKPRLRGLSRAMAPRPSLPTGALRANASRPPRNAQQKGPVGASRPHPTQKAPSKAACRKSARPFPWPAIPAATNERLFAPQKKRAFPGRRRILLKANAPVPPHRDPPRERLSRPPRTAQQKRPRGSQPTASNAESPIKSRVRKERAAFLLARHPRSHQRTTLRAAKETGIPGAQAHPPKGKRACPSPPGPSAQTPPVPRETCGKSPPEGTSRPPPTPARRFPSLRPVFPGTPPRMGMRPGKSGAFRHQTRQLARLTLLSRAESAQPGVLGMPTNTKIALIYKNQVRFCFPGWRTFSTPGAPLTALPRAPRCRVRG